MNTYNSAYALALIEQVKWTLWPFSLFNNASFFFNNKKRVTSACDEDVHATSKTNCARNFYFYNVETNYTIFVYVASAKKISVHTFMGS